MVSKHKRKHKRAKNITSASDTITSESNITSTGKRSNCVVAGGISVAIVAIALANAFVHIRTHLPTPTISSVAGAIIAPNGVSACCGSGTVVQCRIAAFIHVCVAIKERENNEHNIIGIKLKMRNKPVQTTPVPLYPVLQAHEKDPTVLVHVA